MENKKNKNKKKNNNNNSSNSLVFGRWPQTKIGHRIYNTSVAKFTIMKVLQCHKYDGGIVAQ